MQISFKRTWTLYATLITMRSSIALKARLAGAFYLLTGGTAYAEFVRSTLVVHDDASKTAYNILSAEPVYRFAIAADLGGIASYLTVTLLLYVLLKPVDRNVSLFAAFFGLVGVATQSVASIAYFAPLLLLGGERYLTAFDSEQLKAMALLSLHLYTQAFNIALVFFGFYNVVLGYLIFQSSYFPRILGVLVALAGLGLLINSFATLLSPAVAHTLMPITLGLDAIGELSLMLWLIVMGVNVLKWEERRRSSETRV